MKWLITAFEPFGGAASNSSLKIAQALAAQNQNPNLVFHWPVPVTFSSAWTDIENAMARHPGLDGVLALGQSEGRGAISLERIARNRIDARIPDNEGIQPQGTLIEVGGERLKSQIPWQDFRAVKHSDLVEQSNSAGAFVCNFVMYKLLRWADQNGKMAGFVHIPVLRSQDEEAFQKPPKFADESALSLMSEILDFLVKL